MRLAQARVLRIIAEVPDLQKLDVCYLDRSGRQIEGRALNYLQLTGTCQIGDRVIINTTAADLGLGTGGVLFVIARIKADAAATGQATSDTIFDDPAPDGGHIIKLRYTPLQRDVLAVEEQASPHHQQLRELRSLEGKPVICCELHSQVPLVAAAIKSIAPEAKVVYCHTDQAALMLAFSENVRLAKESGLIDTTISCGQALGGDYEAVTLHSGLLAAKDVAKADAIIVGIGPGIVGTDTAFGHGGIAQGEALNAAGVLQGEAIAVLRLSFADARSRHWGVSHHSICALSDICLVKAQVPLPLNLADDQRQAVDEALAQSGITEKHRIIEVDTSESTIDLRGLAVTTMGRDQSEDPAFFSAAYAAGILAGNLHLGRRG